MKKLAHDRFIVLLTFVLCLNLQCSKTNPVTPPDNTFSLMIDDASCTEVFLRLEIGAANSFRTVTLKRDTTTLFTKTLAATETAITDTNLLPAHSYTYHAQLSNGSTAQTQARTMDTTSHNWSFQQFELGDGSGSSALYDVAIVNDTLVYAVGEIYQGGTVYDVAKWNGRAWRLDQLYYSGNNPIVPIRGILVLKTDNIWLAAGGVFHWDGVVPEVQLSLSRLTLSDPNATIEKLWGISDSFLYGVGNSGTIVHFNGSSWTKIESGTALDVRDIVGSSDGSEILAIASNDTDKRLLKIQGNTASSLPTDGLASMVYGNWFVPNRHYYVVGAGIHFKHALGDSLWTRFPPGVVTSNLSEGVRGSDINDVFVTGSFLEIVHFNGTTWHNYRDVIPPRNAAVGRIAVHGNLMITVGIDGQNALVIIGKRL